MGFILQALETSPEEQQTERDTSTEGQHTERDTSPDEQQTERDNFSSDYEGSFLSGFSDVDGFSDDEVIKLFFYLCVVFLRSYLSLVFYRL